VTEDLPPPYVDDRLVQPETREERLHGRRLQALPANPEHGDEHTELDYLARGDLAPGYVASTDLLTRAGEVARALRAKGNPVIAEVHAEGRAEGLAEGRVEAIELLCQLLDIPLGPDERARMDEFDAHALLALLTQLQTQRRWPSA